MCATYVLRLVLCTHPLENKPHIKRRVRMKCPKCWMELPHTAKIRSCTVCGIPLVYDVHDVFTDHVHGIVKEIRDGQTKMAKLIDEHLRTPEQTFMLLEGGTGIGKSYAYLVPSMLLRNEKVRGDLANDSLKDFEEKVIRDSNQKNKIIIATTKKLLQTQICKTDLRESLIPHLNVSDYVSEIVMKSQSNYACTHPAVINTLKNPSERARLISFISERASEGLFPEVEFWEGDRPAWWNDINVDNCIFSPKKTECPRHTTCCPSIAKSNFLVSNQALVSTLLANRLLNSRTKFGACDTLIIDEAHLFISSLYKAHTRTLTAKSLGSILKRLRYHPYMERLKDRNSFYALIDKSVADFKTLHSLCQKWHKESKADGGILKAVGFDCSGLEHDIVAAYAEVVASLEGIQIYACNAEETPIRSFAHNDDPWDELFEEEQPVKGSVSGPAVTKEQERRALATRLNKIKESVSDFKETLISAFKNFQTEGAFEAVPVVTENGIEIIPSDIRNIAAEHFKGIKKVIFLSATMCVNGTFNYIRNLLGLDLIEGATVVEGVFESPFDYAKQAVVYLPLHIDPIPAYGTPPEDKKAWFDQVADETAFMIEKFKGDALVLFTSQYDMDIIFSLVKDKAGIKSPVTYLKMEKDKSDLFLEKFRETDHSALFGLKSYWEGVDIPGDKLRLVVVVKLPFPVPSDPIITLENQRAKAEGKNPFNDVSLPRMLFDLRQGTGRLIRRKSDRGIVAILDSRIWTGGGKTQEQTLKRLRQLKAEGKAISPIGYGLRAFNALCFKNRVDTREKFLKVLEQINKRPGVTG